MPLGISFIPGTDQQQQQDQQQPQSQSAPALQQALQMLSLRVPRFGGPNAILPDPLLQGRQPGQPLPPQPGTPEWEELMRRLRGGQPGQPGQPPGAPPLTPPGPNVKFPAPPDPNRFGSGPTPQYPTIGQHPGATPPPPIYKPLP